MQKWFAKIPKSEITVELTYDHSARNHRPSEIHATPLSPDATRNRLLKLLTNMRADSIGPARASSVIFECSDELKDQILAILENEGHELRIIPHMKNRKL
jgi:hypothetical protein